MDIYIIGIKGQYVQTKKRFKNLGKIVGIVLFVALMFTNIKIALMDDAELASGDISVFGIELNLFEGTYGEIQPYPYCSEWDDDQGFCWGNAINCLCGIHVFG